MIRSWPWFLGGVSVVALAVAIFVERGLGIAPCELCLVERWPWRVAIAVSLAALVLPAARAALRVVALLDLLVSAGLGVLHAGVEQGWWPSPFPACHAPALTGGSISEQIAALPAHAAKPCDAATFLIPGVPVSMAQANLVLSVVLILLLGLRPRPHQGAVLPGPP